MSQELLQILNELRTELVATQSPDDLRALLDAKDEKMKWLEERLEAERAFANDLQDQLRESKAETAQCVEFLGTEMGWEYFRTDFVYGPDEPEPKQQSKQNALMIKKYLEESGHGLKFLAEKERLEARARELEEKLEAEGIAKQEGGK